MRAASQVRPTTVAQPIKSESAICQKGGVSVTMRTSIVTGEKKGAMEIQRKLMPVHKQLFVEANPIPVKWAMARMGLCGPALRLPMTPLSPANEPVVEGALRAAGLLA